MRIAEIVRKTAETDIMLTLNLDGTGKSQIQTKVGFLDHMLTLFAAHGKFDLNVTCNGDTWVDDHHSAEDIGICLGQAFAKALGDKGYTFVSAQIEQVPGEYKKLDNEDDIKMMEKMIDAFEDDDDVQNVWHNWDNE